MNILQILPELNFGGVETGVIDLTKYLVKVGHKVVVVSAGGLRVKELESLGAIHYQLSVEKKSPFTIIKTIPALVEIIKKENIDIVHARSRVPAWISYFAARKTKRPLITTCHGYYSRHLFSWVMGWAKLVICPSKVIAQHMIEDFGVSREKIRLIPRGVDLEKFRFIAPDEKRKDGFNVGIIGRLTPLKGHLYFIKAMAEVAKVVPKLKIWIIGDAPSHKMAYKEDLKALVRRLGLWPQIEFLGNQKDIPSILENLDLLVLASITHEAFGRVIIEAQASGVPVVATRVGGVIDIIEDGLNGLLVAPASSDEIAKSVIKIFQDPQLARRLAENAYRKVKEEYSLEKMAERTLKVYQEAINNFRILIIKFSSLGDIILSTAALRAIRKKFAKNHKINLLVSEEAKELFFKCPYIDDLLVYDFKNKDKGLKGILRLACSLRKENFDIVIDLQNNHKSHIISALTLSPKRYGYDRKFGFLLNYRIKYDTPPIDPLTHQFRILKMLEIDLDEPSLELWPTQEDQDYIDEFLRSNWISYHQKMVGINISASQKWTTKVWPLDYIIKLCEELGRNNIRVIITGTEKDLAQADTLINHVKETKIINACGKTNLNQLACLIKRCNVYVSADSAPLHIAVAIKTPIVALFGPTDPLRHLPPVKECMVIKKNLNCSPCYKSKCKSKKCMHLITPEEVYEAIKQLIKDIL